ncbi:MAG: hypothetical protein JWO36_4072, partial [Myxococcales bacterium]|nr:hypothetical protein [Myxococcales bacterium]
LHPADFIIARIDEPPPARASAETALHQQLYRDRPEVGAILHGHSIGATQISLARAAAGSLTLSGYELLKAFSGVQTHEARVEVPVFANSQDVAALAATVSARLASQPQTVCYLIAGHGSYVWGASVPDARRHFDALEFLIELEARR